MTINLKEIQQKTYRYAQQDGFTELFMGIFFVFYGGVCYDLFSDFTTDFPVFPFILFFAFFGAVLEIIRRRVTYPRIGRAKIVEEIKPWYFVAVILPLVLLPVIMYIALRFFSDVWNVTLLVKWSPALLGIVLVGLFHDRASKTGNTLYYGFAVLSVVIGVAVSILDFSPASKGIFIFFLPMGGAVFLFGLGMFIQFVRTYPVPEEDTNVKS